MTNGEGQFIQQVTWENYKLVLPERLWEQFCGLAQRSRSQFTPLVYVAGVLRWANADEN